MYLLKYLPEGPHGLELVSSSYPAISALDYSRKPPYPASFVLYGVCAAHLLLDTVSAISWLLWRTLHWMWNADVSPTYWFYLLWIHMLISGELLIYVGALALSFEGSQYFLDYANLHPNSLQWFHFRCIFAGAKFWSFWSQLINLGLISFPRWSLMMWCFIYKENMTHSFKEASI